MRIKPTPSMIPPNLPVNNPLLIVAMGFGADVTLAIAPSLVVVVVDVGASRMVLEVIVDMSSSTRLLDYLYSEQCIIYS
jgi:hypothetical protein